ncbi:MAG: hypothetical protein KY461_14295 [Actinobacteria bacterium]|nr:hypothetical protein [Actinomycetota bacterium]
MLSTARALLLALALVALAACGGADDGGGAGGGDGADGGETAGGDAATVTLVDFDIEAPASVPSGTSLTVVNEGGVAHTFTAQEGADFDTGTMEPGAESEVTVEGSGTVSYVCTLHPEQMQGSFEVTEG